MKKLIKYIILAAVLVAMLITNPKKEAHIEAVAGEYKEAIHKKLGPLSILAGKKTLEGAVNNMVEVSDYGLVSVGKYNITDAKGIVSLGIFNHVFVFTKDDFFGELGRAIGAD